MFCFRQFEDWVFQPPLNLLMFKFLTGKHSKPCRSFWNLRSLLTRDTLSWAEGSQMCAAWLPERENQSKWFTWWSLSALPLPKVPFSSRPPSWPLSPQRLGNQRDLRSNTVCTSPAAAPVPQELYWLLFDCVTHSWRSVQPGDKSLTARSHSSPGGCEENDQGSATRLICLVNQREAGEAGREDKEPT